MKSLDLKAAQGLFAAIHSMETLDIGGSLREAHSTQDRLQTLAKSVLQEYPQETQTRVWNEFFELGPLDSLLSRIDLTEILVNGPNEIWVETQGQLQKYEDSFYSEATFQNVIHRLCHRAGVFATHENPFCEGSWGHFRLSLIRENVTQSSCHLSLRRHPEISWTFSKLQEQNWCQAADLQILENLLRKRANFLVIGPTGSGKTSVLNSFLNLVPNEERVIIIEDTAELKISNQISMKLITREDSQKVLSEITQTDLLRRCLRLRPDRIVMGEIRGSEAKDFLMSLATGHTGCFGSLHAKDPQQALLRLEMLIQMGAPQWSLLAIRRLIQLSLEYIVVVEKTHKGQRKFGGLHRLIALEEHGFLLEPVESIKLQ